MLHFKCVLVVFPELQMEILQTENQLALLNSEIADLKEVKVAESLLIFLCSFALGLKCSVIWILTSCLYEGSSTFF